jgi:BTB/POZ domain
MNDERKKVLKLRIQTLFMENTCEHPIVFLKDIKYTEIRAILDYMYKGEVNVVQVSVPSTFSPSIKWR